ncbi:TPM domain-containing protein [Paracoccus laeviglucosivorans]|uniref:TPM domain-containing protein n=1 Tax=Paracoccus laeviglucosivorans TaxID=1197861 RepID=A0A521CFD1_9RHOB|nr:TPM domain-containing protein [Paracoccus laeviglucosivorans]SMO58129.1 uncharacterized protein SAMN06265221_104267 [Paracoccus laeviglucosivorans]
MRRLLALLVLTLGLAVQAVAQDLPEWRSTTVNDFAGLLTADDARVLERALTDLRDQTGVQGTVVTLTDRARYGGTDGLEPFATRLFNHWGVGDAARNDGFMLLVLSANREARIELGRGYSPEADILAQDIMRGTLLPAMRKDQASAGIRQTTDDIIRLIARPVAAGNPVTARESSRDWTGLAAFAAFGAILLAIARKAWRRRRCPQCNRSGVTTQRTPERQPLPDGGHMVAAQQITRHCPHCGWQESRSGALPRIAYYGAAGELLRQERNRDYRGPGPHGGGGGFGGGSSRGGGASGRW